MSYFYSAAASGSLSVPTIYGNLDTLKAVGNTGGTRAFDVGSGSNRCLVACVGWWGASNPTITVITYNGTTLGAAISHSTWQSGIAGISMYRLVAPATGTNDFVLTFSGAANFGCVLYALNGVDQSSPIGTPGTAFDASSNSPSVSVTSLASDLVIDALAAFADALTYTPGTGQTIGGTAFPGASSEGVISSSKTNASSMDWTISGGGPFAVGQLAVPFHGV